MKAQTPLINTIQKNKAITNRMNKILSYVSQLSTVGISLAIGAIGLTNNANAAALQGRVGINPPSPVNGVSTGVLLTGTGITGPNGNPLTDFDFVPPTGGGAGPVVELNANPNDNGFNDFLPFVDDTGTIKDVTVVELLALNGLDTNLASTGVPTPIPDFINIPGAFSFTLENVSFPEYSFSNVAGQISTTVSVSVDGTFINLSDGSLDRSHGIGTFSVDFADKTIAETQALFDEPGEMPSQFNPGTWSSNFVATDKPIIVPEASNLLGLLLISFVGGVSMFRRKK